MSFMVAQVESNISFNLFLRVVPAFSDRKRQAQLLKG